jgi:hypothetical protein
MRPWPALSGGFAPPLDPHPSPKPRSLRHGALVSCALLAGLSIGSCVLGCARQTSAADAIATVWTRSVDSTVTAMCTTHDGQRIVAGTADGRVLVMERDGRPAWETSIPRTLISEVAADDVGDVVAARVFDPATQTEGLVIVRRSGTTEIPSGDPGTVRLASFPSSNGKLVLVVTSTGRTAETSSATLVALYDSATGKAIWHDTVPDVEYSVCDATRDLGTVAFGGVQIPSDTAASADGALRVWQDGRLVVSKRTRYPVFPTLLDEKTWALTSAEGSVTVLALGSAPSATTLWRATAGFPGVVRPINGRLLIGSYSLEEDGGVRSYLPRLWLVSRDGATIWSTKTQGRDQYTPLVSSSGSELLLVARRGPGGANALYARPSVSDTQTRLPMAVTSATFVGAGDDIVIGTAGGAISLIRVAPSSR